MSIIFLRKRLSAARIIRVHNLRLSFPLAGRAGGNAAGFSPRVRERCGRRLPGPGVCRDRGPRQQEQIQRHQGPQVTYILMFT
jgi:hypothetical protein